MAWILRAGQKAQALPYVSQIDVWDNGGFYVKLTDDIDKAVPFDDWGQAFYLSGCVPMDLIAVERS